MIIEIHQTKTNFSMSWEISRRGKKIAEAEAPFMPNIFIAEVKIPDATRKLIYEPSNTSYGQSLVDRLAFRLFDKDHYIGYITGKNKIIKKLFASYPYYEYVENDALYQVYEVGFGRKGLFLCFYRDDRLFCIVEKELTTINHKDHYTCYLTNPEYLPVISSFVIYYDVTQYGDFFEITMYSKKTAVVNTYQKELKAKFDPNFIPKIKALEGIDE